MIFYRMFRYILNRHLLFLYESLPFYCNHFCFQHVAYGCLKQRERQILLICKSYCNRSSRPEVFCRKSVLRNFAKFTVKRLCQDFPFSNVAGLRAATLLKKRLWRRCFPVNFVKFLRTAFFIEHLRWLLLLQQTK